LYKETREMGLNDTLDNFDDFKEFLKMVLNGDPKKRLTIKEIKGNPWFLGPKYNKFELRVLMRDVLKIPQLHQFN